MEIKSGQCKKISERVLPKENLDKIISGMRRLCEEPLGKKTGGAIALAHCQVDHEAPKRFFVYADGRAVINPEILSREDSFWHTEGCMSFPYRDDKKIRRYRKISVKYFDENGNELTREVEGLEACVFQHEIDHMNGTSIYL